MWMDPRETGVFLGQCAQYCGTQHAKMLLRVYVQPREEFSIAGCMSSSNRRAPPKARLHRLDSGCLNPLRA